VGARRCWSMNGVAILFGINARHHAINYLDPEYISDQAERERVYRALLEEVEVLKALPEKYRGRIREPGFR
jgi:hypothetical protein